MKRLSTTSSLFALGICLSLLGGCVLEAPMDEAELEQLEAAQAGWEVSEEEVAGDEPSEPPLDWEVAERPGQGLVDPSRLNQPNSKPTPDPWHQHSMLPGSSQPTPDPWHESPVPNDNRATQVSRMK